MGSGSRPDEGQPESSSRMPASPSIAPMQQSDRSRKPPVSRRMSFKRQIPNKRQGFSTEDDVKEVEEDIASRQTTNPQPSPRIRPLRQQSSTLRRRANTRPSPLLQADENDEVDGPALPGPRSEGSEADPSPSQPRPNNKDSADDEHGHDVDDDEDEGGSSDAESFTLKDRQQAINETHPFGIRIWKPALYKKSRSVEKTAEGDIHSSPGGQVGTLLFLTNLLWSLFFGWWLALAALIGALACSIFAYSPSAVAYGRIFAGLSWYLAYPFGSFVQLESDENYADEDEGEGRSISEYEQWQNGDVEHGGLFFGPRSDRSLVGRRRNSVDSAGEERVSLGDSREAIIGNTPRLTPNGACSAVGSGLSAASSSIHSSISSLGP